MTQNTCALVAMLVVTACTVGDPVSDVGGEDPADSALVAAGPALIWPRVARGDSNQDVTVVQYLLGAAGQSAPATGSFDATTEAALREFQRSRHLFVDGIAGEQTWLALLVEVSDGATGLPVDATQYLLKNRYQASLDVTGTYGPTTKARVETFQTSRCLEATGVVGRYTWNALIARRSFCSGGASGGAASRVLAAHNAGTLTLWDETFGRHDGADPLANVTAAAAGRAAMTSCYGTAPCTTVSLSNGLINGMAALREQYGFNYFVTAIVGASHAATSYHYAGRAFDVGEIDGTTISGDSAVARQFMDACRTLGAIEVLGPSNDSSHQDHVHCAW